MAVREPSYSGPVVVTAGEVNEYITKLAKLGPATLKARIAKINSKIKAYTRMLKSGKFAAKGKPGPERAAQANFALRGCRNALNWHEQALKAA